MTDILGLEFIKQFHTQTEHLQHEGPRLLHVDCHSSHINLPLLHFARSHDIIILGYPPHTTHLLQGLDFVVFSSFKNAYAKHAAEHLKVTGEEVDKPAFLSVLHKAVQESFTEKNILMAWKKTGLRPINPTVISDADLAPCKEFASVFTLPLPPPSPICAVVDAIYGQYALTDPHRLTLSAKVINFDDVAEPAEKRAPLTTIKTLKPGFQQSVNPSLSTAVPQFPKPTSSLPQFHPSDYPDPLALLTARFNSFTIYTTLDAITAPPNVAIVVPDANLGPNPPISHGSDPGATCLAGEILRGLASTRLAPLLELETVTSACELPPIERGPLPMDLAKAVESGGSSPSPELWDAIKVAFPRLVSRADRLLAQTVLQEIYCQRLQRTLKLKEKPKNQTNLKKIMAFGEGLIFTSDRIMGALEEAKKAQESDKSIQQAENTFDTLEGEAEAWREGAIARQNASHAALIEEWKAIPENLRSKRRPPKPRLEKVPQQYKEALEPKKRKPRTRKGSLGSEDSSWDE